MSQTQNGQEESLDNRLKKLEELLNNHRASLRLPEVSSDVDYSKYVSLSPDDLLKMTEEECGIAAYVINQYVYFLQKKISRQTELARWAKEQLIKYSAAKMRQYTYSTFEERLLLSIKDDVYGAKLYSIMQTALSQSNDVAFLTNRLENIAKNLTDLQYSKRRFKNG